MKKTVLIFGLISGGISAGMMLITIPFSDRLGFEAMTFAEVFPIFLGVTVLSAAILRRKTAPQPA
jgi:hypothetical protein